MRGFKEPKYLRAETSAARYCQRVYLLFAGGMIGIDDVSILGNNGQDGTVVVAIGPVSDNDQQSRGTKQEEMTDGKSCADRTELAGQLHHHASGCE